jgi:hypothetical protein
MLKLNTEHQSLTLSYPPPTDLEPARRLIVPVQSLEADLTAVSRRIWALAESMDAHILFIGLCNDTTQEPALKRNLVTLSAMLNYGRVTADSEVIYEKDWLTAVRSRLHPGDMIVYWDDQPAGLFQKPLNQILRAGLDVPIYMIASLPLQNESHSTVWSMASAWIGFLVIILGSLFLQIKIYQFTRAWATPLVLFFTVVEFWLIWGWNKIFG